MLRHNTVTKTNEQGEWVQINPNLDLWWLNEGQNTWTSTSFKFKQGERVSKVDLNDYHPQEIVKTITGLSYENGYFYNKGVPMKTIDVAELLFLTNK